MRIYILLVLILILNYTSFRNGDWFYTNREYKRPKVFDLAFSILPKLNLSEQYINILNWLFGSLPFLPFLFNKNGNNLEILYEMIQIFIPVYFIRALTTNFTILPSDKKCDIKNFTLNELIQGHCYDKLFSGHLALAMIAMYTFWKNQTISSNYLAINMFITIVYMLLSRGHYTNDLVFSFFVVYFVINENWRVKF